MTFPILNSARFIAVLVTGSNKAATVRRVEAGRDSIDELPIRGVSPLQGDLRWYLDAAACARQ
jgi:6-phosphogluconolactonase/glucosamine-6-phosphate isomerase/deaminase